ncbi:transposase [Candidatus Gracilibacteria bacterium]|nr:transposase [Candidatus Gracilibacteria bacterium]
MGNRILKLQKETFYHIYNRGCNKQTLFFEKQDFKKFFIIISKNKKRYPEIEILAYSVLPNHFHLLLQDNLLGLSHSNCEISNFMQKIQQSYTMFFNTKYGEKIKKGRKSPIFEGRFQAKIITEESYLEYVKMYIEWNGVKHGLVKTPEKWLYSSYNRDKFPE